MYSTEKNYAPYSKGYANDYAEKSSFENHRQTTSASTDFADAIENRFYYDSPATTKVVSQTAQPYRAAQSATKTYDVQSSFSPKASTPAIDYEAERQYNLETRYAEKREAQEYDDSAMTYTTADFNPSETTMQFVSTDLHENPYEDFHAQNESKTDKQYAINTKGKILIAVYALVVVTVFALIILNTRLLKSMNNSIRQKQEQVQTLKDEVTSLNSELKYVSSDEVIIQKATDKGWSK